MRITAGRFKGRSLATPAGRDTRPTSDRARQAVFNILAHGDFDLQGARVLDAFAGSGALGLEALSRGASSAIFMEIAGPAIAAISRNIAALDIGDSAEIMRLDPTRPPHASRAPVKLAFLDPPYRMGMAESALPALAAKGWLAPGALCIAEIGTDERFQPLPGFTLFDERRYGAARIVFLTYDAGAVSGS